MYSYYFLASAIGKNRLAARKRYLWWGQYLTLFQMFQFVTMILQVRFSPPVPLVVPFGCHSCRFRDRRF